MPLSQIVSDSIQDGAVAPVDLSSVAQYTGFKNRIINGAMVIDQRNAGASTTPTDFAYSLDRWKSRLSQASKFTIQQNAGSVTPPSTFSKYLGVTVGASANVTLGASDYFAVQQIVEGFNFSDMAWGTSSAATVTLSFWVRSSLTGTFGGALQNGAENRSYGFTYTISAANTWEQKSITIAGDQSGTWIGATNGIGLYLNFNLGTGSTYGAATNGAWSSGTSAFTPTGVVSPITTNSATWYVTGVQLEKGVTATSFDYRPYGTELILCQRYYLMDTYTVAGSNNRRILLGGMYATTQWEGTYFFPVEMRSSPTLTTSAANTFWVNATTPTSPTSIAAYIATTRSSMVYTANPAFGAAGYATSLSSISTNGTVTFLAWSAEL